jgi:hypothetical protein
MKSGSENVLKTFNSPKKYVGAKVKTRVASASYHLFGLTGTVGRADRHSRASNQEHDSKRSCAHDVAQRQFA